VRCRLFLSRHFPFPPLKQRNSVVSRPGFSCAPPHCLLLTRVPFRYTGYDGSADPSDTENGFVCEEKHAKLNDLSNTISQDIDWRAYVEVCRQHQQHPPRAMLTCKPPV
jgi:hypothetical protein